MFSEAGDLDAHQQEDAKAEEEGDAATKKKEKKKKKKKGGAEKEKSEEPVTTQEVQGELALQEDKGEQPNEQEAMKEEQLDGEVSRCLFLLERYTRMISVVGFNQDFIRTFNLHIADRQF